MAQPTNRAEGAGERWQAEKRGQAEVVASQWHPTGDPLLPMLLVGFDHRLLLGSTIGSFVDQPSALSPVTESTIEQTNTRLVGQVGTQKPHRNTQFTRTSTRRKMNSVLDGDERRGANAPISWLYFT
jgi:hypothetical protein